MLTNQTTRRILADGKMTLPADWRKKNKLEEGDAILVEENKSGALTVVPAKVVPA